MPLSLAEIVAARRRKTEPTAFEKKTGYRPGKRVYAKKASSGPAARPMNALANANANPNRSYSYMTSSETWKIRWGK